MLRKSVTSMVSTHCLMVWKVGVPLLRKQMTSGRRAWHYSLDYWTREHKSLLVVQLTWSLVVAKKGCGLAFPSGLRPLYFRTMKTEQTEQIELNRFKDNNRRLQCKKAALPLVCVPQRITELLPLIFSPLFVITIRSRRQTQ